MYLLILKSLLEVVSLCCFASIDQQKSSIDVFLPSIKQIIDSRRLKSKDRSATALCLPNLHYSKPTICDIFVHAVSLLRQRPRKFWISIPALIPVRCSLLSYTKNSRRQNPCRVMTISLTQGKRDNIAKIGRER